MSRKIITSNSLNLFTHAFFKIKAYVSSCAQKSLFQNGTEFSAMSFFFFINANIQTL